MICMMLAVLLLASCTERELNKEAVYTEAVPAEYLEASEKPGTVTRLDYESEDYVGRRGAVTKTAFVYTPYGYDEDDTDTRYDIIYLMHGWRGHTGEDFEYPGTKNLFDNLIANGDMHPAIIVSATFYGPYSNTDFKRSEWEVREFHRDFREHLMPAAEGKYHTYAASVSDEDLKASRDHRAFGGFSLGAVTTWLEFCHDYDYIRYFLPVSGSSWYYGTYGRFRIKRNVDFIEQLAEDNGLDEKGYFIFHAVGTEDSLKKQTLDMADEMLARRDVFTADHYGLYLKEGGRHDLGSEQEFMYNALPLFFRGGTE